jgi:hypothetical protein
MKSIPIIQINVNGLRSRRGELEAFLQKYPESICLINDSRLHPGIPTPLIQGKTLYRKDAALNGSRSGGVIIAIPEKWTGH